MDFRFDDDVSNKIDCNPSTMIYELNWNTCFMIITEDATEDVIGRINRLGKPSFRKHPGTQKRSLPMEPNASESFVYLTVHQKISHCNFYNFFYFPC